MSTISLLDSVIHDLPQCEQFYISGADDYDCPEPATVFHLDAEVNLCRRHFRAFDREFRRMCREEIEQCFYPAPAPHGLKSL